MAGLLFSGCGAAPNTANCKLPDSLVSIIGEPVGNVAFPVGFNDDMIEWYRADPDITKANFMSMFDRIAKGTSVSRDAVRDELRRAVVSVRETTAHRMINHDRNCDGMLDRREIKLAQRRTRAQGLTPGQPGTSRVIFDLYDMDEDGEVSTAEIAERIRHVSNEILSEAESSPLLEPVYIPMFDMDGDGRTDRGEVEDHFERVMGAVRSPVRRPEP